MSKETCHRCDCEVTTSNCAMTMDSIAWDQPMAWNALFADRVCIRCSPSRAQHIVHPDFEPVADDRQQFDKRNPDVFPTKEKLDEWEKRWTLAWLVCQNEELTKAYINKLCATTKI